MAVTDEAVIKDYVVAIESAYVRLRQRFRPDLRRLPGGESAKLHALAGMLRQHSINPYNYMQFIFDVHARYTGDVYCDMVTSPASVSNYLACRPDRESELTILVRLQTETFQDNLARGRDIREILQDYSLPMSAVFRYAVARGTGEHDLSEQFKADAERMILFEPFYKKLLCRLLPEEMTNA